MNVYGYWQYEDEIGLSCNIVKYDLVYVFRVKNSMATAINENGEVVSFHVDNISKEYFNRPSHKFHKTCKLGEDSKNNCHKCRMYNFKKTVKRFEKR